MNEYTNDNLVTCFHALMLEALSYDKGTEQSYWKPDNSLQDMSYNNKYNEFDNPHQNKNMVAAPELGHALRWLNEEKKIILHTHYEKNEGYRGMFAMPDAPAKFFSTISSRTEHEARLNLLEDICTKLINLDNETQKKDTSNSITEKQIKALTILSQCSSYSAPLMASEFVDAMWNPTSRFNPTGEPIVNAAGDPVHYHGMKANLSAGSFLRKLENKGWVTWRSRSHSLNGRNVSGYCLTKEGEEKVKFIQEAGIMYLTRRVGKTYVPEVINPFPVEELIKRKGHLNMLNGRPSDCNIEDADCTIMIQKSKKDE